MRRPMRWTLAVIALAVCPLRLAAAVDSSQGWITGLVTDETDAMISGAKVELLSSRVQVLQTVVTGDSGRFTFGNLSPGTYRIRVTATAFKPILTRGFRIVAGKKAGFYFTLETSSKPEVFFTPPGETKILVPPAAPPN